MPNETLKVRTGLGLSQVDLARLLDCSRTQVSMLESGKRIPQRNTELYLLQAHRLYATLRPLPELEIVPPPAFKVEKEIRSLEHELFLLDHRIEDMQARCDRARRLLAFCADLRQTVGFSERKLEPLTKHWEGRAEIDLESYGAEAQAWLFRKREAVLAQLSVWKS